MSDIYYCLIVTVLFFWGALSDERTGLSSVHVAGPCQHSFSRVLVPWDSLPYFTVSDSRLPFLLPPTTHRVMVEVFNPASTWVYSTCSTVRVRVTLRLAVYRQSVRLGVRPLEAHDQRFFFQPNSCSNSLYVTSSLTRSCPSSSHIATDNQSVCLSWCRAPAGAHDQIFFCLFYFPYMKVTVLFIWGAFSNKRLGLSFVSHSPY
jgi:hypothetical protein